MKEKLLAEFTLSDTDQTTFLVEVEEPEDRSLERVALLSRKNVIKAKQTFEEALESIKPMATKMMNKLQGLQADEVEVKFGLNLTADAGAILAKVGGEVSYEITLKCTQHKSPEANG
ncbi:MAG: CU044_2847 family protein [Calothrix sp. MO_167.B42]|nr:CU044_2847 family protein [Calothrix sp. MO_167.B42]